MSFQYPGGGGKFAATFPPSHAQAVTTTDTPETPNVFVGVTGIMVAGAGDVAVRMKSGADVTLPNLQPGIWHPAQIVHVFTTGTTVTGAIVVGGQ